MNDSNRYIMPVTAAVFGLIGMIAIAWWLLKDPMPQLTKQVPGMDGKPEKSELAGESVEIGAHFLAFNGKASALPGHWPQFRGERRDNIVKEPADLADTWDESGPRQLWSIDLGEGHAAPAVRNGRVYLLDYDEIKKADALRCFSLDDGTEIWRRWYIVRVKRNHGLSRTVPAVTDKYVVTIGPKCHVMCVDAMTGDYLWGFDLEREYGSETPFWYTGQCPLIEDDVAVIAPAGSVLMMGVDCATGRILWQTPNPNGWKMSHASVMPMTLNGRKLFVYSAVGGMAGVAADGPDAGKILWETRRWTHSVLAPSPLILPDGRIILTAGYGAGSAVLKVSETNGQFTVEQLQEYSPKEGLASEQQTPIFWNDHIFSIQPKDAGGLRQQLVCYHPDDCTALIWSSGRSNRFGLGPYLIVDDKMLILDDDGVLTLIKASVTGYEQLAQAKILSGHDAWGPLALAGTRLLARDDHTLVCLELGGK